MVLERKYLIFAEQKRLGVPTVTGQVLDPLAVLLLEIRLYVSSIALVYIYPKNCVFQVVVVQNSSTFPGSTFVVRGVRGALNFCPQTHYSFVSNTRVYGYY